MATQAVESLVLKVFPYGESSQILHVLSPLGRLSFLAKGAKRKKSSLGGPFDCLEIFRGDAKGNLNKPKLLQLFHADRLTWFPALRKSLKHYAGAELVREILLHTPTPRDDAPDLMVLAIRALELLDDGRGPLPVLTRFLARWLALQGLKPELHQCVVSGRTLSGSRGAEFSLFHGGLISPSLAEKRHTVSLSAKSLELFKACLQREPASEKFRIDAWREVYKLGVKLVERSLGSELLSARMLWKECK